MTPLRAAPDQYDQNRNLLFIFGGKGNHRGTFSYAASVGVDPKDGRLFILDQQRNNIQVLRPTEFASLVHTAIELYNDGRYEDAVEPWNEVLRLNSRYDLVHIGLGRALLRAEEYVAAMREFQSARPLRLVAGFRGMASGHGARQFRPGGLGLHLVDRWLCLGGEAGAPLDDC